MKPIKELYDVCYMMEMSCGGDVWRLHGKCDGKERWTSSPISYDMENNILTTASGSRYHINNFYTDAIKVIDQIQKDIAGGGFELH